MSETEVKDVIKTEQTNLSKEPGSGKENNKEKTFLKSGDHMIHVLIDQTRGLRGEGDQSVNPKIKIDAFSITKYSNTQKDIGTGTFIWNEHIFIEKSNVSIEEVRTSKLLLSIYHSGKLSNKLIGCYEMDIATI